MWYFSSGKNRKSVSLSHRMKKLYLFNPENDMALASGSPHYMAPASAKKMAADLSPLPMWYADGGSRVWVAEERQAAWMASGCRLPLPVQGVTDVRKEEYGEISAWAWSPALLYRLRSFGAAGGTPFFCGRMAAVRALSSRRTAVGLLPRLRMEGTEGESVWLTSVEDVCRFSASHDKVLLKAPWSGSGKGIQPLCGEPDDNLKGWARRIIASQGGVVGEPYYNKVKDFAMEFRASDEGVRFAGYSLFEADARGIYKENVLASDEAIGRVLSGLVPGALLHRLQGALEVLLADTLGEDYRGYLGVDMMVVRTAEGACALHPCVEVNLRMNMGVVARLFFDRHVCREAVGRYVIEHFPCRGDALRFQEEMVRKHPLRLREGRIEAGYLSLTPVFEDTCYVVYAVIHSAFAGEEVR